MYSPAPTPELVRPWRTATLVATTIAVLELVLLIVAGVILLGRSLAPHADSSASSQPAAVPHAPAAVLKPAPTAKKKRVRAVPELPRTRTHVVVLNGNGVTGAAAAAASIVTSRGYRVDDVTNAPNTRYATWRVMYRPRFQREAKRFAKDMGLAAARIGPLDGMKPAQLKGAQLVLILGAQR